ncbi:TPA: NrtA/SsuA/CpmA family ABC transporter substrate-binding protein [Klebsiella pneumoniae]|uniref:ABC transporter substrate-binding protein n=8 Tax=Enterobacterales TaxID=91347 RepID=A0A0E3MTZ4_KLEPN|nr:MULTISPECIES: NrtA/SsuA/CpmA family ABC transporter substrate-binding protein [Enterobacteriaceae]QMV82091.1 ABC transporter substrate-binding protein [Leclercia sp.]QZS49839.1 NrtA/SsuA/CpmA family ABC transporter substrate-binding protein [Enterobacter cloacae complex sp.]HBZ7732249.1 NrtA/SsuA/CpmA family ABC transporter substrate-binding protein [Klebsiella variicola subsp. variicola]HCC6169396.1 NrtA/SsuA/CpmA family ABC transporter substrate-binding protein [Citrobacter amalonaticus]A
MFLRRLMIFSLTASLFCTVMPVQAADTIIRVGTLKLIHGITPYFYDKFTPKGYKVEVVPFETPTDGKNAVVTHSVDFGGYGLAAAVLGGAAGEPVVVISPMSNGGMGLVVSNKSGISSFKDLKNKRIGILTGSTQETVFLERLKSEGMTIKDVKPIRVSFSEMAGALERGDIDAYVGAEPGPSISVSRGIGKVLEYPYSTSVGSVNMVMTTHADTLKNNPEFVKVFLEIHRKASEYAMANRKELLEMANTKLGLPEDVASLAADNVKFVWRADDEWLQHCKNYGSLMLERKQIRRLPENDSFLVTNLGPH